MGDFPALAVADDFPGMVDKQHGQAGFGNFKQLLRALDFHLLLIDDNRLICRTVRQKYAAAAVLNVPVLKQQRGKIIVGVPCVLQGEILPEIGLVVHHEIAFKRIVALGLAVIDVQVIGTPDRQIPAGRALAQHLLAPGQRVRPVAVMRAGRLTAAEAFGYLAYMPSCPGQKVSASDPSIPE